MDSGRRVLSSKSPATKYEVMLLEDVTHKTKGPCEERIALCLDVFDEVIPHLGVYRKIITMLREELYSAVYSSDYTTLPPKKGLNKTPVVQRVPFFALVNRLYAERDKRAETLQEEILKLQKDLNVKGNDLEQSQSDIEELKQRVKTLEDQVFRLKMDLNNCNFEKIKLEATLDQEVRSHEATKDKYEKRLANLREQLIKSEDTVKMLRKYKDGYDDLEEAFNDSTVIVKRPHNPAPLTKKSQVSQEIASAKLLEEQLLTLQNAIIEEFDAFIEDNKAEPYSESSVGQYSRQTTKWDEETKDLKMFLKSQQEAEDRFKKSIADIENELQLIEIQRSTCEEKLEHLELEKGEEMKREKRARKNKDEEEIDFVKIMSTPGHADPFIPHERVMSKYAAMMYYSCNHGKNFHEFKDAKFCPSCGETTLMCPHKVVEEKLVSLPHNCTHIKITRPVVHILKDEKAESLPGTPDSMKTLSAGTTPSYGEEYVVKTQQHLTTSYKRLWDDLSARTSIRRRIPRPLEKERILSVICQFYATLLWQDDYAMEDEHIVSVLDTLHTFFQDRYIITNVSYLGMHDFLSGIVKYAPDDQTIQLFAQAMCGNLDPVVIRYILLMNDIIDLVDWVSVNDVRVLAQVVYPFMHEEDLEQFTMGYTSFSENKISKELVSEYLLYIILKYREPCFQDTEVKLLQHPGNNPGFMTDIEFTEAIDNICPLASERLRRRLFAESLEHMQDTDDSVNIMRLSQITGYLKLVQISQVVKDHIAQKVEEARVKTKEELNVPKEALDKIKKQLIMEDAKSKPQACDKRILTMEYIRGIAVQNSKRVTARQIKRVEGYQY